MPRSIFNQLLFYRKLLLTLDSKKLVIKAIETVTISNRHKPSKKNLSRLIDGKRSSIKVIHSRRRKKNISLLNH